MAITNFEQITQELNEKEMQLLPFILQGFKKHFKESPIKAPEIVKSMNDFIITNNIKGIKLTEARLRKFVNHIRQNSILPLIATSVGYYISNDVEEINLQIRSLEERAKSIKDAANGLYYFTKKGGMRP